MMEIHFPWWFVVLMLILYSIPLFLSGLGIYYLVSNRFEKIALIISTLIFLALITPKSLNPHHWSEFIKINSDLIGLIVLTLSYFTIFSVVNFIYRSVVK
jgi:hypothetical protein